MKAPNDDPPYALFHHALQASATPVLIIRSHAGLQTIVYVNPAFEGLTGHSAAEVRGLDWSLLYPHDWEHCAPGSLRSALRNKQDRCEVFRGITRGGATLWLEMHVSPLLMDVDNSPLHIALIRDVTASQAEREQLEHRAYHDALTGLPNRHLLQERFDQAIARARRHGSSFAVVFIDLDGFKFINDSFGHETGDEILRQVGHRLAGLLRAGDTASRVGGDEFVLLLEPIESDSTARVVERMSDVLQQPIAAQGHEFIVSCCIGITCYPADGLDPATLLRNADHAMYEIKRRDNEQPRPTSNKQNPLSTTLEKWPTLAPRVL